MKGFNLILAVLPLLLVVSCAGESTQDKQARLCTDLATLNTAVVNLKSLSPSSTVGDLKQAEDAVSKAFSDVQNSAKDVQNAKLDDLQRANDNLDKAVRGIPDKSTLRDGLASVSDEIAAVEAAQSQLRSGLTCP